MDRCWRLRVWLALDDGGGWAAIAANFVVGEAQDGSTALVLAAWHGYTECVRLLLESGADKEATDDVRCIIGVR